MIYLQSLVGLKKLVLFSSWPGFIKVEQQISEHWRFFSFSFLPQLLKFTEINQDVFAERLDFIMQTFYLVNFPN